MMTNNKLTLVGYQDQENLGVGYLAGMLEDKGFTVQILDLRKDLDRISSDICEFNPAIVGFSLIFQFYLPQFGHLASHLRSLGVESHFTIGGHYPSLCPDEVLQAIPELDSLVQFEGELTLWELAKCISQEQDWREIDGIAYTTGENDEIVKNPLRRLIDDLDQYPFPKRVRDPDEVLGQKMIPILGSRGCPHQCSFCSIITFYGDAPGKSVRRRNPEKVVQEMKQLYDEEHIRIFLFQDDDFPLIGKSGKNWVNNFIDELKKQNLYGRVLWKISCRSDEVRLELFSKMRDAGLFLVYMGLEAGTEAGLETLNKGVSVDDNLNAISILKKLGIMYEYGFMLFEPNSTFSTVRGNLDFLHKILGDGSAGAVFCKMLPYIGTPIEKELRDSGRLKGDITQPDYDFMDPRLNEFYDEMSRWVKPWLMGRSNISNELNLAWYELYIIRRLFPETKDIEPYKESLTELTQNSNQDLFDLITIIADTFEHNLDMDVDPTFGENVCQLRSIELKEIRNGFIFTNQDYLMSQIYSEELTVQV